jgi:hypothetical protein
MAISEYQTKPHGCLNTKSHGYLNAKPHGPNLMAKHNELSNSFRISLACPLQVSVTNSKSPNDPTLLRFLKCGKDSSVMFMIDSDPLISCIEERASNIEEL